jgi:uncharacterized membrane protein YtjA (UPF0391 family)
MLGWALTFLIVAIIAGAMGLGNIALISGDIAQLLFIIFFVLFVVAALAHALRGRSPPI